MGVLDDMTKGITERKAKAAGSTLTPVGLEGSPTKPSLASVKTPASFPNDVPVEEVRNIRDELVRQRDALSAVIDALSLQAGEPEAVKGEAEKAAAIEAKLAEKEADRRAKDRKAAEAGDEKAAKRVEDSEEFDARMQRLSAEAQAAVFTAADAPPSTPVTPAAGWVCPEHGDEDIEHMTSRLRPAGYSACAVAGCGEFEPKE